MTASFLQNLKQICTVRPVKKRINTQHLSAKMIKRKLSMLHNGVQKLFKRPPKLQMTSRNYYLAGFVSLHVDDFYVSECWTRECFPTENKHQPVRARIQIMSVFGTVSCNGGSISQNSQSLKPPTNNCGPIEHGYEINWYCQPMSICSCKTKMRVAITINAICNFK